MREHAYQKLRKVDVHLINVVNTLVIKRQKSLGKIKMAMNTGFFSKKGNIRFALATILVLFISGCAGSNPSLSYYLLHSAVPSKAQNTTAYSDTNNTNLVFNKVTLPDYLKHRGLVYQVSDTNLHISATHLWAEPVEEGLRKSLSDHLALKNISLTSAKNPLEGNLSTLNLYVSDFISTYKGNVVLKGDFVITDMHSNVHRESFLIETELENDGFSASITAMRHALVELASKVADSTHNTRAPSA
ncbi:hypothetical protein CW735_06315 [Alteromonas sp. MB-3u-76]|nr:hypothetical protein CW735_06315 [Alteromonas sp. MB-3u-76]